MRKRKVSVSLEHVKSLAKNAFSRNMRGVKRDVDQIAWEITSKYPDESSALQDMWRQQMSENIPESNGTPLVSLRNPEVRGVTPRLSSVVQGDLNEFLLEVDHRIQLADIGESPRRSFIFTGPSGVGKTITARWLARKLGYPLVEVSLSSNIGQFLGVTGNNMRRVFDYARGRQCVLLLDEVDTFLRSRGSLGQDGGEMDRVVNGLLREIEEWTDDGVLIAITNMPDVIDDAVWRRFDTRIDFEVPGPDAVADIVSDAMEPIKLDDKDANDVVSALTGKNGGEIVSIIRSAKRKNVIRGIKTDSASLATGIIMLVEGYLF